MFKSKLLAAILTIVMVMGTFMVFAPTTNAATLVWSDEFNGTSLDTTNNWVYETGTGSGGWGNNELEYYTNRTNNVNVTGGNLVITAIKESYGGMNYTSGRIKTQGKQSWTYGTIEARIKLPVGQGIWPAFWMLGNNITSVGWPACGEIDIMEHVNNNASSNGTMHWDFNGYSYYGLTTAALDYNQFHIFQIQWDSSSIKWFVDGVQYCEGNILNSINGTDEFHRPFFILLNLAVGGNWPGSPDGSTVFPATMLVDYVRVYSGTGGGSTPTPTPTPGGSTPTPTPTPGGGGTLSSTTWYAYNTSVSGVTPAGQILQTAKSGVTGWQPLKTINTTPSYFYASAQTGTYNSGNYSFTLWSANPGASSQVKVELYKTNSDGSGAALLGSQTLEAGTNASGNHFTTYTISPGSVALSNQRLMVKITKVSGVDLTMCYNTNDFPTRLVTP